MLFANYYHAIKDSRVWGVERSLIPLIMIFMKLETYVRSVHTCSITKPMDTYFFRINYEFPNVHPLKSDLQECYDGEITRHFVWDKTPSLIKEHLFRLRLNKDVERHVKQYEVWHITKTQR